MARTSPKLVGVNDREKVEAFKSLAVSAAADVAGGRDPRFGIFLDGEYGARPRGAPYWIAPIDHPLTTVRQFPQGAGEAPSDPAEWPVRQIVKLIANARPDAITRLDVAALKRVGARRRGCGGARSSSRRWRRRALPRPH